MRKISKTVSTLFSTVLVFIFDQSRMISEVMHPLYGPMQPTINNNWGAALLFFVLPIFIVLTIAIALVVGIVRLLKKKPRNAKKNN